MWPSCFALWPTGRSFDELDYGLSLESQIVAGDRVAIHAIGAGDPPLVLVHGLGSDMRVWSANLSALAGGHRVVALDLPGFGRSAKPRRVHTLARYVAFLRTLIEQLGGRAVVLGHSMGGQIALRLAIDHPERVAALVLSAPAGLEAFTPREAAWIRGVVDDAYTLRATPLEIAMRHAQTFHRMPRAAWPMLRDRLAVAGGPDIAAYARAVTQCVHAMLDEPVRAELGQVAAPTLVTFGRYDGLIPNRLLHGRDTCSLATAAVAHMPAGALSIVEDAGHMPQLEQPARWNATVLQFLTSAISRRS
jgi:pimeloyl-ACP methyl ester carboxylesterase